MRITVAIPTYGRDKVLVDTIASLLGLTPPPWELLVIDQTPVHDAQTHSHLVEWEQQGRLRWLRLAKPSITTAMNTALLKGRGDRVLFLDDDISPDAELLNAHLRIGQEHPDALIAGRVLQPWHEGSPDPEGAPFLFNSLTPRVWHTFMGGNVSIPRKRALELGGFDQNFVRVAYHFEAEFAFRWRNSGHPILYTPDALIHHLRAERGGTRSYGKHLTTIRPDHAVGRYYYQLRTRPFRSALFGSCSDLFRSVVTRHHLRKPWWIPLTFIAESRAFLWALKLNGRGPSLLSTYKPRLLIVGSHPVQYHTPLFQALAQDVHIDTEVLYLTLPGEDTQGLGFGVSFTWDVPLLEGYQWREARSGRGRGITSGYRGVWLRHPMKEIGFGPLAVRPDVLLLTGWHFLGLVQIFMAALIHRIPVLLRMDSNGLRPRSFPLAIIYWLLFRGVRVGLTVGIANQRFYRRNGVAADRLIPCPHYVDNTFFIAQSKRLQPQRTELRRGWNIPEDAFCFLFAGKLQNKKRPLDLLAAFRQVIRTRRPSGSGTQKPVHLLIVGTGHLEGQCREIASLHQLPVTFTGFMNQSEIPAAYVVSDCLVLPSDHGETWGLVVNEAMACGLPAIVSDLVGCAEDLVHGGHTGFSFPFSDIDALAGCMNQMAADPKAAAQMGSQARELIKSGYSIEKASEGILKAMELVLQRSDLSPKTHDDIPDILSEDASLMANRFPSSLPRT